MHGDYKLRLKINVKITYFLHYITYITGKNLEKKRLIFALRSIKTDSSPSVPKETDPLTYPHHIM